MKELTQKCVMHLQGASYCVLGRRATKLHNAQSPSSKELVPEEERFLTNRLTIGRPMVFVRDSTMAVTNFQIQVNILKYDFFQNIHDEK